MKNKTFFMRLSEIFIFSLVISVTIGFAIFFRQNLNYFQYSLKHRFEIAVFLKLNVTAPEVVGEKIKVIDNVADVVFISKQEIRDKLKDFRDEVIIAGDNPFPDTFSVTAAFDKLTPETVDSIVGKLKMIDGVEDVRYDGSLLELVRKLHFSILFTGWVLRVSLGLIVILLVFKAAANYGRLKALFNNKTAYIEASCGLAGSLAAIAVIAVLKKALLIPEDFVSLTFRGNLTILLAGLSIALIGMIKNDER